MYLIKVIFDNQSIKYIYILKLQTSHSVVDVLAETGYVQPKHPEKNVKSSLFIFRLYICLSI